MVNTKTGEAAFSIPIGVSDSFQMQQPEIVVLDDVPLPEEDKDTKDDEEITFELSPIPGAPPDVTLDEEPVSTMVEEPPTEVEDEEEEDELRSWEKLGLKHFPRWLKDHIEHPPSHTGHDTTGIERVISYYKRLNTEISRAMAKDYKGVLDSKKLHDGRVIIFNGIKRLNQRLKQLMGQLEGDGFKGRRASFRTEMIKTAETSLTGNITINVPYFISFISRACINASVSNGKDMKDTFEKLAKEYKLDNREKVQVIQLIKDMGYPLVLDRLRLNDGKLEMDKEDGEFAIQYSA